MAEKLMVIDGNSIVNRAFYGVPLLTNAEGRYTNAVYGFLNIMFKLIDEEQPDYLAVAFDMHAPTFRHVQFEAYKGTRKGMPEELLEQMPLLKQMLKAMGIRQIEIEGYEADDILGTLAKKALEKEIVPVVISGDRDLLQLATDIVKIRIPKTKGGKTEIENYYAQDVIDKYGVTPKEFIDVKALMGDASDNIPGVPSIGEKTAVKIIQEFKTLENAIANATQVKPKKASENLSAFEEQARMSRFLAEIDCNVPIDMDEKAMGMDDIFSKEAYELAKTLDFKSLLSRFQIIDKGKSKNDNIPVQIINEASKAQEAFALCAKEEILAYSLLWDEKLLGISLYNENIGAYWIESGEKFPPRALVQAAKTLLESDKCKKIAHDAKKDIKILRCFETALAGVVFDTALAAYILNPTRDTYGYDDIANEFLKESYISEEELLGKGKSKKMILDLPKEQRADFAANQAVIYWKSKRVMEQAISQNGQEYLYYEIELPLLYVLADMEHVGIKVNQQALEEYGAQLQKSIEEVTNEIFQITGEEFNLNSPKQLGVILFEKLGLKGGKKTKTGYSTAADVLEKLKLDNPVVEKILYYRQLAKLKSTYVDGLLAVMDKGTGKIYSTFNQTITATGRISSTEPNLQNIPIRLELGRELRKVFIPSSEEYCLLDADYSQIELRVLAHISGDETLIEAFRQNQDIHRLTASQVFNVPFDEVTSLQRRNAKAVNFGIVYGIGAFSLSQDLEITRKEAERYIAGYFEKYPKIRKYMDETIRQADDLGYAKTMWERRRAMPELQSGNFVQRSFGERVAMNMPIQGSAADIIKIAMVRVHKCLKEQNLRSRLILQVHDELLIEAFIEEKEQVAALLKREMEQAANLAVPLVVDVHEGNSWFEAK